MGFLHKGGTGIHKQTMAVRIGKDEKRKRFVVVGNGIAGISAAYTIRRYNKEAKVIIISEEPHPTYSPCMLPNYLSGEISRERIFIRELSDYSKDNIQLITSVKAITLDPDRKRIILKAGSAAYDKLIVATGSKPIIPPIHGTNRKGVFTFKSIEDGDSICRWQGHTVVVVGSGPIGVEASLALRRRGYQVFLIELLDRILPQIFDEYPASLIQDVLKENGIDVTTQERAVEILGEGSVEGVISDRRKIKCDTVILATGMRPEKDFAEGILEQGKLGGIKVNDRMGTSLEDVYACGDCAEAQSLIDGRPILSLLWHNARRQGEVAGSNAVGIPQAYTGSLNVTGVEVFGLKAVSIGSIGTSLDNDLEIIEVKKNGRYQRLILSNDVLAGVQSINWDENLGLFLAAILRKEKVKTYQDLTSSRKFLLKPFRQFPFGRKLNRVASRG
jgi:NAD(P)H-nitrite reductase large subunit